MSEINLSIIHFIENMLYEHDCIIIPNFGGFIVHAKNYEFIEIEQTILPKKRGVAFNEKLQTDDGLLTNLYALNHQISIKEASKMINLFSSSLKSNLEKNETIQIGQLGSLSLTADQKISFEPFSELNLDPDMFKLGPVTLLTESGISKPQLIPTESKQASADYEAGEYVTAEELEEISERSSFSSKSIWIAAMVFIVAGISTFFLTEPKVMTTFQSSFSPFDFKSSTKSNSTPIENNRIETTIPSKEDIASLNVEDEVKATIELEKPSIPEETHLIQLVAGSFLTLEKAEKGVQELKAKGLNPQLLAKSEGEIHFRISIGEVATLEEGYQKANEIKLKNKIDIWVYQSKF